MRSGLVLCHIETIFRFPTVISFGVIRGKLFCLFLASVRRRVVYAPFVLRLKALVRTGDSKRGSILGFKKEVRPIP